MKEPDLNVLIGKKIRETRILKGISPIELAVKCKIERSNLSRIEAGRTNLTVKSLQKISHALEVPIYELLRF